MSLLHYKNIRKFTAVFEWILVSIVLIYTLSAIPFQMVHAQVIKDAITNPLKIKVADNFQIDATIINNSSNTISFPGGPYDSPISVKFDSRNVILQPQPACGLRSYTVHLQPGKTILVSSPGCGAGFAFKAADSGKVNATITFSYTKDNSIGIILPNNITKSFQFNICSIIK